MNFVLRKAFDLNRVIEILNTEYLPISRFRINTLEIGLFRDACSFANSLKILGPRLRRKKYYCGQHAGGCLAFRSRHPLGSWLEGADWVGFNDMLNDMCDKYRIEANIWTTRESNGRLYLRYGRRRCTSYRGVYGGHWYGNGAMVESDAEFSDKHFGKLNPARRSNYDSDTPGIPEWLKAREELKKYAPIFSFEKKSRKERALAEAAHAH